MEQKIKPIILVVAGTPHSGRGFMCDAIMQILKMSEQTCVLLTDEQIKGDLKWSDREEQFIVVFAEKYNQDIDARALLVFTSKRDLFHNAHPERIDDRLAEANEAISWLRSQRHCYNMNLDGMMNKRNANNFPNLNAIINPLHVFCKNHFQINIEVKPLALLQALDKINPRYERKGQDLTKEEREQSTNGTVPENTAAAE